MAKFMKGDIVVLNFPFSDLSGTKRRPALVVSDLEGDDIILCQITSRSKTDKYSVKILETDFADGKLPTESVVRPNKIFTADKSIILYTICKIKSEKTNEVIKAIVDIIYFRNPVPGVAVILVDGTKIALVKRAGSEKWSIPCGCIEYGEDFVDAAVREVKEEIGIDSKPQKIINVVSNTWTSNSSLAGIGSSLAVVMVSKPLSLELVADGIETTDAMWFDVADSLPELEFDADRYIIGKLKESHSSQAEISAIFLSDRQTSFSQL